MPGKDTILSESDDEKGIVMTMKFTPLVSLKTFTCLLCVMLLNACASGPSRQVADAERDVSGTYDGKWKATFVDAPHRQYIQRWVVSCGSSGLVNAMLDVEKGIASMVLAGKKRTTNVSRDGKFRFEIPSDRKVRGINGSDLTDGTVTVIVTGNLTGTEASGQWIRGVKSAGNFGCHAPVEYTKQA